MTKINLAIIFGGKSAEHEVSLVSAKNVVGAIDKKKYNITLIGISKQGDWLYAPVFEKLVNNIDNVKKINLNLKSDRVVLARGGELINLKTTKKISKIDVAFPVLHGPYGEDGTIQGLFRLYGIPFVGPGVLGSAVSMDKDVMKILLKEAGLPVGKYVLLRKNKKLSYSQAVKILGSPLFIKPANLGSSVGVSKVKNENSYSMAIKKALQFDSKIMIEEFIDGREIECAVLGNENPKTSIPGEIKPTHEFYSYDSKYVDEHGADLVIPAKLKVSEVKKIKELAIQTFKVLNCEGLGRVDFFLKKNGKILINEINTIPGFTSISMYPMLWGNSGIKYADLIDQLIKLAMERFKREEKLKMVY